MSRETIQRFPSQNQKVFLFEDECYRFAAFVTLAIPVQEWLKQSLQNKVASILLQNKQCCRTSVCSQK